VSRVIQKSFLAVGESEVQRMFLSCNDADGICKRQGLSSPEQGVCKLALDIALREIVDKRLETFSQLVLDRTPVPVIGQDDGMQNDGSPRSRLVPYVQLAERAINLYQGLQSAIQREQEQAETRRNNAQMLKPLSQELKNEPSGKAGTSNTNASTCQLGGEGEVTSPQDQKCLPKELEAALVKLNQLEQENAAAAVKMKSISTTHEQMVLKLKTEHASALSAYDKKLRAKENKMATVMAQLEKVRLEQKAQQPKHSTPKSMSEGASAPEQDAKFQKMLQVEVSKATADIEKASLEKVVKIENALAMMREEKDKEALRAKTLEQKVRQESEALRVLLEEKERQIVSCEAQAKAAIAQAKLDSENQVKAMTEVSALKQKLDESTGRLEALQQEQARQQSESMNVLSASEAAAAAAKSAASMAQLQSQLAGSEAEKEALRCRVRDSDARCTSISRQLEASRKCLKDGSVALDEARQEREAMAEREEKRGKEMEQREVAIKDALAQSFAVLSSNFDDKQQTSKLLSITPRINELLKIGQLFKEVRSSVSRLEWQVEKAKTKEKEQNENIEARLKEVEMLRNEMLRNEDKCKTQMHTLEEELRLSKGAAAAAAIEGEKQTRSVQERVEKEVQPLEKVLYVDQVPEHT